MRNPKPKDVAVLVGSLRRKSFSRRAANALIRLAPGILRLEMVEIRGLPLYDQDLDDESAPPAQWTDFRNQIKAVDAVLFVTPEYNRSVPGGLKNAIDVGSRPAGQSVWAGKPAAIMSVAPGAISGFGANHHLRQSLVFLDMPAMPQPEAYIGGAATLFDEEGGFVTKSTEAFFQKFIDAFAAWIARIAD